MCMYVPYIKSLSPIIRPRGLYTYDEVATNTTKTTCDYTSCFGKSAKLPKKRARSYYKLHTFLSHDSRKRNSRPVDPWHLGTVTHFQDLGVYLNTDHRALRELSSCYTTYLLSFVKSRYKMDNAINQSLKVWPRFFYIRMTAINKQWCGIYIVSIADSQVTVLYYLHEMQWH